MSRLLHLDQADVIWRIGRGPEQRVLADHRPQAPQAVRPGIQMRDPGTALKLDARNLGDPHSSLGRIENQLGLDFETNGVRFNAGRSLRQKAA
jgi:hypothetical protein